MTSLANRGPVVIASNAAVQGAAQLAGFETFDLRPHFKLDAAGAVCDPLEITPAGSKALQNLVDHCDRLVLISSDIRDDAAHRLKIQVALRVLNLEFDIREVPFGDGTDLVEQVRAAVVPNDLSADGAAGEPEPEDPDPFPLFCLPDHVRRIVEGVSMGLDCDQSGPALAALVAASAAIGSTIRVKVVGGWTPPISLFGLILGYSGSRKSAMFRVFVAPFKKIHRQRLAKYLDEKANFEAQEEAYLRAKSKAQRQGAPEQTSRPARPILHQCFVEDSTIPSLCRILNNNRRGCLVFRDELAAWLQSFDQFKDRGSSDLQGWINLFNGDSLTVNRKTNDEHTFTENPFVCVLGGIQPPILKRISKPEHAESGLLHRILMVRPGRRKKRWQEDGVADDLSDAWEAIIGRLFEIPFRKDQAESDVPTYLQFTPKAKERLVRFEESLYAEQFALDEADPKIAYLGRQEEMAPRLAGLLQVLDTVGAGLPVDEFISDANTEAAVLLVEWFSRERKRIENELALSQDELADRALLAFLKTGPKTARDFGQFRRELRERSALERVLRPIEGARLGSWKVMSTGAGSRKVARFVFHEPVKRNELAAAGAGSD